MYRKYGARRLVFLLDEEHVAIRYCDRNRAKPTAARTFPADTRANIKHRTVRCTDQAVIAHQKLAWGVIEPTPRMRADVMVCEHVIATAKDDKVQCLSSLAGIDGDCATVTDRVEST